MALLAERWLTRLGVTSLFQTVALGFAELLANARQTATNLIKGFRFFKRHQA